MNVLSVAQLDSPAKRVGVWAGLSILIYFSRYEWLENLSLYKNFGWESAPSIGLTRAYRFLLHGEFNLAYEMNPLIFLVTAIGGVIILRDLYKLLSQMMSK